MLTPRQLKFGEWLPDQQAYLNAGLLEAKNCIPQAQSYRSISSPIGVSDALNDRVVGSAWVRDQNQAIVVLVGTQTGLFWLQDDGSWRNVSQGSADADPAGPYAAVTRWEFARFGTLVVAVAAGIAPQVIDLSAGLAARFADLGGPSTGTPPQAKRVAVVRDFVFLGDLTNEEDTIQWSGFNNAAIWDQIIYQADSQRLYEGGRVQRVIGGGYGLIFQENRIRRFDYVGPPAIFSNRTIDNVRGTAAPDSVVQVGEQVFWYAQDGFFVTNGAQSQPIGEERVNRWFEDNAAPGELENMVGTVDRINRLIVWAFRSQEGIEQFDRMLLYNYSVNRWSYAEVGTTFIAESRSLGYTLDGLDTPLPLGIDAQSIPVDSVAYQGGRLYLAAFTGQNELAEFAGEPLVADIDTFEYDGQGNRRTFLNGVRPIVEGDNASITISLGWRDTLTESPTFTAYESLNRVGEATLRSDARYRRIRTRIAGGFDHANGLILLERNSGRF